MKEWKTVNCIHCDSSNSIVIVSDLVKYKCRRCSKSQVVNVGKKVEPKVKLKKKKFVDPEITEVKPIIDDLKDTSMDNVKDYFDK